MSRLISQFNEKGYEDEIEGVFMPSVSSDCISSANLVYIE